MNEIIKLILGFIKKVWDKMWFKFLFQIIVMLLVSTIFFIMKKVLPKRYRLDDRSVKEIITKIIALTSSLPKKDDGVFPIIHKATTSVKTLWGEQPEETQAYIQKFAERYDLSYKYDYIFIEKILPRMIDYATETKIIDVIEADKKIFIQYKFGENSVYAIKTPGVSTTMPFMVWFAFSKNWNYNKIVGYIKSGLGNQIYIHRETENNSNIIFERLQSSIDNKEYIQNEMLLSLEEEIRIWQEKKIPRSYIFLGEPGTGKTLGSIEISKRLSNSVAKIDAGIISHLGSDLVKCIFENIGCDIFIIDDLDRLQIGDMTKMLYSLEAVREFSNHPIIIATINNINYLDPAIIRPGRFDEIIEFQPLTQVQREIFILELLKKFNYSIKKSDVQEIAKATNGLTKAYLKEYCLQLKIGSTVAQVLEKIKIRKKYIRTCANEVSTKNDDKNVNVIDEIPDIDETINELNEIGSSGEEDGY